MEQMMSQYATHQRILLKAVLNTGGPMVELGCGWYSTPLLHEVSLVQRRPLITFDNNEEWLNQFKHLFGGLHESFHIRDWVTLVASHCGVVFVDSAPGPEREYSVAKFRKFADVLVLHDTEESVQYGWQRVLPTFEFQYTDKVQPTWTTLCSDTVDVREWFDENTR